MHKQPSEDTVRKLIIVAHLHSRGKMSKKVKRRKTVLATISGLPLNIYRTPFKHHLESWDC